VLRAEGKTRIRRKRDRPQVFNRSPTFVQDKAEWNGTDVVFEIATKGAKTELRLTHVGLVPAINCYGKCAGARAFSGHTESSVPEGSVPGISSAPNRTVIAINKAR
jgi:hypothetical protein